MAGLIARGEAGDFRPGEKVVCVLTGHGLKDPDTAIVDAEPVRRLPADFVGVEEAVFGLSTTLEALTVSAPATSANLGPGFDCLAVALDLGNAVVITRRPGPLEVRVTGEGAGEVPEDASNLVCRALAGGPRRRSTASTSSAATGSRSGAASARPPRRSAAGLVAANALGGLRWTPDDLLARATEIEGHADNAAACLTGGLVAVGPGPVARPIPVPEELSFIAVIPEARTSTDAARRALPAEVPLADAAATLANAVGLTLALCEGRLEDLPAVAGGPAPRAPPLRR